MIDHEDVFTIASAIRRRERSASDIMREHLRRLDAYNGELNAFVWRDDEAALAAAADADERLAEGDPAPFLGVPIAIKDVHAVAGQPNVKGSWSVSDHPQARSDLFIERLLDAGFVPLGRTAVPELAASTTCETDRFGVTRNPWNLARTSAGSTGGGAAAIAAGLVSITSATDGGGSIRMPASACGLVGLKPTRGLFPQRRPNWELSSVDGVLTRTVRETAAVYDAIASPDPLGWMPPAVPERAYLAGLDGPAPVGRVGLLSAPPLGGTADEVVLAAARRALDGLVERGWEVVEIPAGFLEAETMRIWGEVFMAAGSQLMEYHDEHRMPGWLRERIHLADHFDVRSYVRGVADLKERVRTTMATLFGAVDLVVSPTMATTVPTIESILAESHLPPAERTGPASRMAGFTPWVNALGVPAISVPAGFDPDGMPLGVQLVGRPFSEPHLLRLAADIELEVGSPRWRAPNHIATHA